MLRLRGIPRLVLPLVLAQLLLIPASLSGPRPALAQEAERGVSVVGQGRVTTAPDQAEIVISVERTDPSLASAQAAASAAMQAVIDRLLQLNVRRDEMQTIRYSASPIYDSRGNSTVLQGYRVSNAVRVTIHGLDQVGTIIDEAVGAGANRIEGISFSTSRLAELKKQARELAMANARETAEQLARLAGNSLGAVVRIEVSDAGSPPPVRAVAAAAPAAAPPIEGGQLEISTTVQVTWELVGQP